MSERTGGRGLLLVVLALLALAAAYDLLRRDSFLRSLGRGPREAPVERMIEDFRDELPRNRPR